MNCVTRTDESHSRLIEMIQSAFGDVIGMYMNDDSVIEIMLNPDSRLWIERLGEGRIDTGHTISRDDAERVIFLIASSISLYSNRYTST